MNTHSSNSSVIDLISYFEHRETPYSSRQGTMAHPQAVRPGSAGKLLAMDAALNSNNNHNMTTSQTTQDLSSTRSQAPQTPHVHARFGPPMTPQSMHRRGAPNQLKISTMDPFAPFTGNSPYAPTASMISSMMAGMNSFSPLPMSTDNSDISMSFGSPSMTPTASPRRRGHARNDSQLSVVSIQSSNSLMSPSMSTVMEIPDSIRFDAGGSSPIMTPPSSPKKRKSPSKSPQKAKERPNYLDKAVMRQTGVTEQQIRDNIGDPLPSAPKNWRCMWVDCNHVAARKENIRAHVQTHLGDRPYECPECHADFVRPHDFTRHYTTHVDSRDFKCPHCPQAFNRADALQRHRDRDFCNEVLPPSSPTKVKRAVQMMDKKKDVSGRKLKKQTLRKQAAMRQDSVESSDDWCSSTTGSPGEMSSDAGSPEVIMSDLNILPDSQSTIKPSQSTVRANTSQQHATLVRQDSTNPGKMADDFLSQLFGFNEGNSMPNSQESLPFSLSPPASPEETHSQLPLQQFKPSRPSGRREEQNPTPPCSRDAMLDFLISGRNEGAMTEVSAPSLPDLSSASPSPIAYETVNDFDEFYSSLASGSERDTATPDWLNFPNAGGNAEFRMSDFEGADLMKHTSFLDRADISAEPLFDF